MAETRHPLWRGHLRLALVACPVALYAARHAAAELHFHFINPKTGNRVRMVTLDAGTEKEVARGDLVRGYEFKKDTYVLLDDADFERARIDSSATLNVEKFVAADSIDPVFYDDSYYLAPDGAAGADVYAVLREAIGRSGKVALSRLVLARRERSVAVMPMGRGLVLHTLHDPQDLYDAAEVFPAGGGKPDADMVKLAVQLIERQVGRYEAADSEDRYAAKLRAVIEAKLRGEAEPEAEEAPERGNVIDLMAALKRSLGDAPGPKRKAAPKPAGSAAAKPRKPATRKRA